MVKFFFKYKIHTYQNVKLCAFIWLPVVGFAVLIALKSRAIVGDYFSILFKAIIFVFMIVLWIYLDRYVFSKNRFVLIEEIKELNDIYVFEDFIKSKDVRIFFKQMRVRFVRKIDESTFLYQISNKSQVLYLTNKLSDFDKLLAYLKRKDVVIDAWDNNC